jgi:hypothetical protein
MRRFSLRFAYFLILGFCASLSATAEEPLFSLTIAPITAPLKSGAELRVHVTVTNTSGSMIGFVRSPGPNPEEGFRYHVDVRDQEGTPAPPSTYVRELKDKNKVDFQSSIAHWLKPGESFTDEILVTKIYDLSAPRTYNILVSREIPPAQHLEKGEIKSNTITVTVTK